MRTFCLALTVFAAAYGSSSATAIEGAGLRELSQLHRHFSSMAVDQQYQVIYALQNFLEHQDFLFEKHQTPKNGRVSWTLFAEAHADNQGPICFIAGWPSTAYRNAAGRLSCKAPPDSRCDNPPNSIRCNPLLFSQGNQTAPCVPISNHMSLQCREQSDSHSSYRYAKNHETEFDKLASQIVRFCVAIIENKDNRSVNPALQRDQLETCKTLEKRIGEIRARFAHRIGSKYCSIPTAGHTIEFRKFDSSKGVVITRDARGIMIDRQEYTFKEDRGRTVLNTCIGPISITPSPGGECDVRPLGTSTDMKLGHCYYKHDSVGNFMDHRVFKFTLKDASYSSYTGDTFQSGATRTSTGFQLTVCKKPGMVPANLPLQIGSRDCNIQIKFDQSADAPSASNPSGSTDSAK
ncbi:MAG: hypothetical protein IT289_07630 [Oligoflexia bacterium]|nr:hypothetical protein [Oligoflexia bacterium]